MFTRHRTRTAILAAFAVALGTVLVPATSVAAAQAPAGHLDPLAYSLVNRDSGFCMDVAAAATDPGAGVVQWTCNGQANQQWYVSGSALISVNSGLALDVPGGTSGAQLDQATPNGSAAQSWHRTPAADGYVTLTSAAGPAADVPGTGPGAPVVAEPPGGGASRQWQLRPAGRVEGWTAGLCSGGQAFTDQTVRMVVHTTTAGSQVRIHLSNLYGSTPLSIGDVDLAVQDTDGSAVTGTHHRVSFGGSATTRIPAGKDAVSDPVSMAVYADEDLLVSVYLPGTTGPSTYHPDARDFTYLSGTGDHATDDGTGSYPDTTTSWYYIDGLDVVSGTATGTLVAVGDSITDGASSSYGANGRWPDDLARRLAAEPTGTPLGVADAGIGSNEVVSDVWDGANPSLLHRFAHDVLAVPNVSRVILLEGINDIGVDATSAAAIEAGYRTVIARAHAQGVKIYGGTILPFQGAGYYSDAGEATREAVNQWIRTSRAYDGYVDFDAAVRDPDNPLAIAAQYDSGDRLHPNDAGHQAMADAVKLGMLTG